MLTSRPWDASGTAWIRKLVEEGRAEALGGDRYPTYFGAAASTLVPLLKDGTTHITTEVY